MGVATIKVGGNVTEAIAALEKLGITAEAVGKKTKEAFGDKLAGSAERTGGIFGKLGNLVGGLGLPFGESFSKMGEKISEAELEGKKFTGTMTEVGKVMTLGVAAGVGVAAAESIHLAENYQQATASIAAHAGISVQAAKKIGDAFLSTAGSTTYSAQEMAAAFAPVSGEFVNIYGHALDAKDSLTVMKASMDAAEASGEPLAGVTKSMADAMQVFHLKVGDASKAGDDLWNTSRLMGVSISDLGNSMARIEPRIVGSGMNLQQMSGFMLELTHSAGSGRQAMRIVGQAIQQLESPSTTAQKAMKSLGVSFTDSKGNFVGMSKALDELKSVMDNQSIPATKRQTLMTDLFSRQANIMVPLIQGGSAALLQNAAAAGKVGTAQEGAEKQAKTFHGSIEKLKSTAEDLGVKFGEMLIPKIAKLAQVTADVINWFEKHKRVAEAVGIAIGVLVAGPIAMYIASMITAAAATLAAAAPFLAVIAAAAALGFAIYELVTHWKEVWGEIKSIADGVWHALDGVWHSIDSSIRSVWGGIESFFKHWWTVIVGVFFGPIGVIVGLIVHFHAQITQIVEQLWHDVVGFFEHMWSDVSTAVWSGIVTVLQFFESLPGNVLHAVGGLLNDMLQFGENIVHAIVKGIGNVGGDIGHAITKLMPHSVFGVHLPGLATGGIVTSPTLALVGEAGPEAVIPLHDMALHGYNAQVGPLPPSMSTPGAPGTAPQQQINVNLFGVPTDPNAVASLVAFSARAVIK